MKRDNEIKCTYDVLVNRDGNFIFLFFHRLTNEYSDFEDHLLSYQKKKFRFTRVAWSSVRLCPRISYHLHTIFKYEWPKRF